MSSTKKQQVPTPPEPPCTATFPIDPKRPGTRRETFWAEGGRIMCWSESEDGVAHVWSVDRIDMDYSPSGELVGGKYYDWTDPLPVPPSLAYWEREGRDAIEAETSTRPSPPSPEAPQVRRGPLTAEERSERARLAAHVRWSKAKDRSAELAKARSKFMAKFEQEVDPNGEMTPEARAKAAESARKAHFARLAYQSAKVRSRGSDDA